MKSVDLVHEGNDTALRADFEMYALLKELHIGFFDSLNFKVWYQMQAAKLTLLEKFEVRHNDI
jgi:hypothetical protein